MKKHPSKDWYEYINFTDNVLNNDQATEYTLSNAFLSPHIPDSPRCQILNNLRKLSILDKVNLRIKFYFYLIRSLLGLLKHLFKYKNYLDKYKKKLSYKNFDVLIVSHLINKRQLQSDFDHYYGDLISELAQKGKSVLLVLIPGDKVNFSKSDIKNYLSRSKPFFSYILLGDLVGFKNRLSCFFGSLKERKKFLNYSNETSGFISNLNLFTAETFLSPINYLNLLYSIQISELTKITSTLNIITTYEGHSWERLFYSYARKGNRDIKCFGFQHTLIFKYNHSLTRLLRPYWNPDYILTAGKLTAETFNKIFFNKIKIHVLGSPRIKNSNLLEPTIFKYNNILFLTSGLKAEALYVNKFAYNFALSNPSLKIKIRFHPIIKDEFIDNVYFDLDNFEISRSNLIDDCRDSKWAIYSYTTAIYEAINFGCLPVHLSCGLPTDLSDPLWQIESNLIQHITSYSDLYKIINQNHYSIDNESKYLDLQKELIKQIKSLRDPTDIDKLYLLLQ